MTQYLIQNKSGYVGNSVLWWGPNGSGYTTDVDKAGRFTLEDAKQIISNRKEDIAFEESYILKIASRHVDAQHLEQLMCLVGD